MGVDRDDVVGQHPSPESVGAPSEGLHHGRTQRPVKPFQDPGGVHDVALGCGLSLEQSTELLGVNLTTLESSPGVVVRVGRVDASHGPRGETHFSFVGGEGIERAGEDDTAEVKKHDLDAGRQGWKHRASVGTNWPRGHAGTAGSLGAHECPVHLHHAPCRPIPPTGPRRPQGHLPVVLPGSQNRCSGSERSRQVLATADHGRCRRWLHW